MSKTEQKLPIGMGPLTYELTMLRDVIEKYLKQANDRDTRLLATLLHIYMQDDIIVWLAAGILQERAEAQIAIDQEELTPSIEEYLTRFGELKQ